MWIGFLISTKSGKKYLGGTILLMGYTICEYKLLVKIVCLYFNSEILLLNEPNLYMYLYLLIFLLCRCFILGDGLNKPNL